MSLEMPDTPSSPDSLYSSDSIAAASILSSCMKYSTTPGSRLPVRVPIGSPSTAVNPMVLATLLPPSTAHMLAPLPRCSTTVLPDAARASCSRQHRGDVLVRQPVEAVAPHAAVSDRRRQRERLRQGRRGLVERRVEARDLDQIGTSFGDRANRQQVVRLVQGREGHELGERVERGRVDAHRRRVDAAAVHHAVTHGDQVRIRGMGAQPVEQELEGTRVSRCRIFFPRVLADDGTARHPWHESAHGRIALPATR